MPKLKYCFLSRIIMVEETGIDAWFPRFGSIQYGEADEGGVEGQGLAVLNEWLQVSGG